MNNNDYEKGTQHIIILYRYGMSRIKNSNVHTALPSPPSDTYGQENNGVDLYKDQKEEMDRNNEDKKGDKHGRNGESSLSCFSLVRMRKKQDN